MNKLVLIILSFIIASCQANESFIKELSPEFETISFEVVQKQIIIEPILPDNVQKLINKWFDQRVKIDGFDGEMKFTVSDFYQDISSISEGKRVDISLSYKIVLNKNSNSETKFINGNVSSFGTLVGNFSISDFETVIKNTQTDLVLRLSKNLKSKI